MVLVLSIVARITGLDQWLAVHGRARRPAGVRGTVRLRRLADLARDVQDGGHARHGRAGDRPADDRSDRAMAARHGRASRAHSRCGHARGRHLPFGRSPNAFATGMRRDNSALVAVSTGLLHAMARDEIEAVLGPRDHARRQRRHGDTRADPGRHEHLRDLPVAGHRQHRRAACSVTTAAAASATSSPSWSRSWCSGCWPHHRHVVLAPARIPRRSPAGRGWRARPKMIAALEGLKSAHEPLPCALDAFGIAGARGRGPEAAVHESPAAGGAHRARLRSSAN